MDRPPNAPLETEESFAPQRAMRGGLTPPPQGVSRVPDLGRRLPFGGRHTRVINAGLAWFQAHLTLLSSALSVAVAMPLLAQSEAVLPLDGAWRFALDPEDIGVGEHWFAPGHNRSAWRPVIVPHTWQIEAGHEAYQGTAWYARTVGAGALRRGCAVRLEFDAVNRDAQVWWNGRFVGDHVGSGYTPFAFALDDELDFTGTNTLVVRVDNRFSTNALPYRDSFDWPMDGGILRSVRLRFLPPAHLERVLVRAQPTPDFRQAALDARIAVNRPPAAVGAYSLEAIVFDPGGDLALHLRRQLDGTTNEFELNGTIDQPALWHFDHPRLYRLECRLRRGDELVHVKEVSFGIREVQLTNGLFYLNGEPMRLLGVEWMPGSHPAFGLAEPPALMRDTLADLKRLNAVLTRFHWQQDHAVLEFCDREGMLVQEEVPAWGAQPLDEPQLATLQEQHLREMILAHFNHPSIFAWGLGNEIKGLSRAGQAFVERGKALARALDPTRLLTYASNTLHYNPARDAAGRLDFLEWNDYFGTWFQGGLPEVVEKLDAIHRAYPGRALLISEYGLCECRPSHPVGDAARIQLLRTHTEAYRRSPMVAGAIFFSYNDYRTHKGDKGQNAFQQRIHGVVDLTGRRKPSWEALRKEASPIRSLTLDVPTRDGAAQRARVRLITRALENDLPAYTLRGYRLTWTVVDVDGLPQAAGQLHLPDLPPGADFSDTLHWPFADGARQIELKVTRPRGHAVHEAVLRID
jgi:beta-glucuronidase